MKPRSSAAREPKSWRIAWGCGVIATERRGFERRSWSRVRRVTL